MADGLRFNGYEVARGGKSYHSVPVTTKLDGTELAVPVHVVAGTKPGPTLSLFSTLHGGEWMSIEMLRRVVVGLDPREMAGNLIAVPVANPVAFSQLTRTMPDESDSADLNRVFPGQFTWMATQIARTITNEILPQSDALIDFHLGLWGASFGMVVYGNDFSDPDVSKRSEAMARAFGCAYIKREQLLGSFPGPGSMVGYAGEKMGLPSMISEIGGAGFAPEMEEGWIRDNVDGIRSVLRQMGILPGEPIALDRYLMAEKTHRVNPSVGGYLHTDVSPERLNTEVTKGELLGRVLSPYTFEELERLESPVDGWLLLVARPYPVNPGDWAYGVIDGAHATWET